MIRAIDLHKEYRTGPVTVPALRGVTLTVDAGEFVSIMGPSGSGKSTLFNQVGALDRPTEGRVFFMGESVFDLSESQQAWFRCNQVGYIFQTFNLVTVMSALQNVTLPMTFQGASPEEAEKRGKAILERVGLGHRVGHRPNELSGGERQRVAIARALANNPSLILADEPTGNLDTDSGAEIMAIFGKLHEEGNTLVIVTHERYIAEQAETILHFKDGQLVNGKG